MKQFFYARLLVLLFLLLPLLGRAGTPVLRLEGTVTTGDVTAFVDQVEIVNALTGATVANAVPNAGFESFTSLSNGNFGYNPAGATWAFVNSSGIATSGGGFGNPATSPEGTHVAFLQSSSGGYCSQTLPSLGAGYYFVRVQVAQRNYSPSNQGVRVVVDGRALGSYVPANDGAFHAFTSSVFAVDAVLRFEATGSSATAGADVTAFVDQVELLDAGTGTAVAGAVANAGFETTGSLGTGSFGYNPTGTGWTFTPQSGIATNGSDFNNPASPEGTHVALLQTNGGTNGYFTQTLGVAAGGSYQLRVKAAQRPTAPADQRIRVWLGNVLLATLAPVNDGTFQTFTASFTVTVPPTPVISSFTPTTGGLGTTLRLTGTGLAGATAVTFTGIGTDLVATGFTADATGTSITGIVVPPGARTGTITVTTPAGTSAPSAQPFTLCEITPRVQNLTVTLNANGVGTVAASAFNNGSTSSCGGAVTATVTKGGLAYGIAPEWSLVTLTAPPSFVFTDVLFASYGTPIDLGNGNYARGGCHSAASVGVVSSFFIGHSGTESINAYGYSFRPETCPGTSNRLAIRLIYSKWGGMTPTLTYDCGEVGTQPVLLTLTDAAGATTLVEATVTVVAPPLATISSLSSSSALPGQTVTVTGTNLSGATALTVNGAAATISALTTTGFNFVVPVGAASSGNLVLSVPCTPVSVPFAVRPVISSFTPTSGVAGNTISLTGGGVRGTTAITFTGPSNNVVTSGFAVSADGTTLTGIVVPAGVQTGPLTITTPSGTSAASSQVFTMTRPAIDVLTPAGAIPGATIAFSGSFLTGATAITFTGNNVVTSGFTVNAAGTQITGIVVPAGAQSGPLTVTTPIATSLPSSQSFTVCRITPVVQTPTLSLGAGGTGTIAASAFNNGSTSSCGGALTATSIRKGGVAYSRSQQDNVFTLAAPPGYVFTSVDFASYGIPTDNGNGNYVISGCHSANSQSIVEGLVLGRNYVSIGPTNAMFGGSPCSGVKYLAVRATYTLPGNSPGTTQDYSCTEIGSQPILLTLTEAASGATITVPTSVNVVAPAATISSVSPNPALPGQTVTVTGTNLNVATALTVNGAAASFSNLTATGFSFVVPATALGTGSLALSLPCGQTATQAFRVLPAISGIAPASESLGARISLTGTAMNGATAIAFAGSSNNVVTSGFTVSTDGTSITGIVVPAGTQTGTLTVATSVGLSAPSNAVFTVLAAPTISSFTPASGPVGSSIGLTGTNLQGVTAVAFSGTSGNVTTTGFAVNAAGTQITGVVVPNGAQTGPITVMRAGGSSATSTQIFTVCRVTAVVRNNLTLNLDPVTGTAAIAASAFNNGSTSNCGGTVTATLVKGGTTYTSANENYNAFIGAPTGTIFTSVDFASYGNPIDNGNGNFTLGNCHAASSQSVVEGLLLGRTGTIAVGAGNYLFGGDPCPGTAKRVAVRAGYTPTSGSGSTATLAYTCADAGPQPVLVVLTDAASGAVTLVNATVTVVAPPLATISSLSSNPALPGQTVTVTGTNLAAATALTVNGATATISNLTGTGFSFVVPAGATSTGNVVLSVPCTAATQAFAVRPVLSAFTPTSGSVGTTVTLTGTGLNGATTITFTGTSGNVVTSGFAVNAAGTQITGIVVPAGVQTGPLAVTTAVGTASTSALSPADFTVVPRPAISSLLPTQGAAGTTVQLTGTNLTGATTVRVNGVDTPATNVTSTGLTFVVPAGGSATQSIVVLTPVSVSLPSTAFTVLLQLVSTSPAAGALTAPWTNPTVGLTFSEPLSAGWVNQISLFGSQSLLSWYNNSYGSWSLSGNTATYRPNTGLSFNPFKPGEVVSVTVPGTVQSTGGLRARPRVYQFTTATGGLGRGTFRAASTSSPGSQNAGVKMYDVDFDGDLDLLTFDSGNHAVNVSYNDGTGLFAPISGLSNIDLGSNNYPTSMAVGQYRANDGAMVVMTTNEYNNSVSVVYGDNNGLFYYDEIPVGDSPHDVAMADLNGDGQTDFLTANPYNNTVSVRLQYYYSFTSPANNPEVSVGNGSNQLAVGDLDGDGDLDFVTVNGYISAGSSVSVRLNDGSGSFTPPATGAEVAVENYSQTLALGDVDGDGDLDLLTAVIYGGTTVSVRLNDGSGHFPALATSTFAVNADRIALVLGDVDADGDLDLVTSSRLGSGGAVYFNNGQGGFTPQAVPMPAGGPVASSVALGDVDGDGDLDLATSSQLNSVVSVALNQCLPQPLATLTKTLDARGLAVVAANAFEGGSTSCSGASPTRVQTVLPQGSVTATANQNGTLTLTAPAGTVFTAVTDAYYGDPRYGTCYSRTIQQIVESYLLNQGGTISIPATAALFAPSCSGIGVSYTMRVTATYSTIGAATDSLRYTCAELGTHPVLLTSSDNGTTSYQTFSSVTVTAPAPVALVTWRGTASADWTDCRNWSYGQVPDASTSVMLPAGRPNYPSLPAGTFALNDLTLASGASLSSAAGTTLQVRGSWTNQSGTLALAGPVAFVGSTPQVIGGSTTSAFSTLTVNNAAGLALTQPLTISSALTLTSGVLATGAARITLASAATLSETETSYVTGTVQTTRDLSTAGTGSSFGGLGLTLTPALTSVVLPGSTLVERRTGASVAGLRGIGRSFAITPAVDAGLNVTMVFRYFEHELNSLAEGSLQLYKSDLGSGGPWAIVAGTSLDAAANTATQAGIASLSVWTLGTGNPLPVELVGFTATPQGEAVRLAWATASEKNSNRFEVERSLNGRTFSRIGTVAAAGSSMAPRSYGLLDGALPSGSTLLYYRLRQVDLDSTFAYSPVRTVMRNSPLAITALALFPNPAHATANLTGAVPGAAVQVFDALGRIVASAMADAAGTAVLVLPEGLATGVYVVRVGSKTLRLTVD